MSNDLCDLSVRELTALYPSRYTHLDWRVSVAKKRVYFQ
ncbi:hypothetical protein LMG28138_01480 [Pararobbsia alpina]|uniref:Uncharacterized protein n=1 Tax=Pararobbsia alpina TaxID=621374 RepID=A0A6S7AZS1_9BURK|nr:hypothetical protein LMG28138_01480 [Pararobbsia alpina]